MRFLRLLSCAVLAFTVSVVSASAQDAETVPSDPKQSAAFSRLEKRSQELLASLGGPELKHLYHIREAFGSTRAVRIVRRDVQNAVKACGGENPDMKAQMDERFAAWTAAIDPVVKEKDREIDAAINAQSYLKPKEIKDYLKMIEKAADEANNAIRKIPVTTPDACESLLKSMDRTQETVTELVGAVELVAWPPEETPPPPKITTPN